MTLVKHQEKLDHIVLQDHQQIQSMEHLLVTPRQYEVHPTASHISTSVGGTTYDTFSVATTANTGFTTASATSQHPQMAGGIPIIRPPGLEQQSGTGVGVFGPSRPAGYPTQPPTAGGVNQQPIKIDVASAQQQYQQRTGQLEISPHSKRV